MRRTGQGFSIYVVKLFQILENDPELIVNKVNSILFITDFAILDNSDYLPHSKTLAI